MYGQYKRGGMVSAQRGFGGQPLQQMQFQQQQQQNPPNVGMAVDAIVSGLNQQQQQPNSSVKKPASALILEYQKLLQKKKGNDGGGGGIVNNNQHDRNRGSGKGSGGILRSGIAPLQMQAQPMLMNMDSNYVKHNFMSDMYSRPSDSDSSAEEDDEDDNGNDDNGRPVSLSHRTSVQQQLHVQSKNNPHLPEMPNMSALVPDIDIKPVEYKHCFLCARSICMLYIIGTTTIGDALWLCY